ncbi:MAG: hypothetical protein R3F20_01775 [Planctomycetota bacterium]
MQSRRAPLVLVFSGWLLVGAMMAVGCGDDADAPAAAETRKEDAARHARREKEAEVRFRRALAEAGAGRLEELGELAHVYWDTESGSAAWKELILALMRRTPARYAEALRELETFRGHAPASAEAAFAAQALTQAIYGRLRTEGEAAPGAEERAELEKLEGRAARQWVETVEAMAEDPRWRNDYTFCRARGEAYFYSGDLEATEKAWAAVESLEPAAQAGPRVDTLIARATLLEERLQQPERARELLVRARDLLQYLDPTAREVYAGYLSEHLGD